MKQANWKIQEYVNKIFMERKQITLVLSFIIAACFFVPLFQWDSFEMNGLNFILSTYIPTYKYFLLLIPFSASLLFFGTLNDENYLLSKKLLSILPFLTLIFVFVMNYVNRNAGNGFAENGKIYFNIYPGFWVTLSFSFLLLVVNNKKVPAKEA